jgi:hypothetical protein
MSVCRRVCSAPIGSPSSDSAESQDEMQARTGRNSEYYQRFRSCLTEKLTPVPQTSRRLYLKKQNKVLLKCHTLLYLLVTCKYCFDRLISVVQNPLCEAVMLVRFYVTLMCP